MTQLFSLTTIINKFNESYVRIMNTLYGGLIMTCHSYLKIVARPLFECVCNGSWASAIHNITRIYDVPRVRVVRSIKLIDEISKIRHRKEFRGTDIQNSFADLFDRH